MNNDFYTHRFEEILTKISMTSSLQSELDSVRGPNDPAMSTDEFRRELLAQFSVLLERERLSDPNVEFNTIAAMTVSAFAKQFSPAPDANEDSVLSEDAQRQLREIFDDIMVRVLNARFKDPNASEMHESSNVIALNTKRRR